MRVWHTDPESRPGIVFAIIVAVLVSAVALYFGFSH